jgi:TolB-like protein
MAVSPLKCWRQLRLAAARSCLLEGSNKTSITEVATRFGFSHFSRFAQDYRHHFGETPSSTLQRSRISGHERRSRPRNDDAGAVSVAPNGSRDRPSIAVLPLQNSAADPDCRAFGEYLADGMATALCRVRSLAIIVPKPSRFRLTDPRQCAPDVGARYLLAGRIASPRQAIACESSFVSLTRRQTPKFGETVTTEKSRIYSGWQIASPRA